MRRRRKRKNSNLTNLVKGKRGELKQGWARTITNAYKHIPKIAMYACLSAALNTSAMTLKPPEKPEEAFIKTSHYNTSFENIPLYGKKKYLFDNYEFGDLAQRINNKKIPVLMFHEIGAPENRYRVSPSNFRSILDNLRYDNYFLVTLTEFKNGNFSRVPTGKKPLLLTFDDAGTGQFEYIPGTSILNPGSAVAILEEYRENHPEFGSGGIFFISYSGDDHNFRKPFMQDEKVQDKLEFLLEKGYDVGWHSPYHNNNSSATGRDIRNQVFKLDAFLYYSTKGKIEEQSIRSYAHPFGAVPRSKDALGELRESFELIFDAWGGMSYHPLSEHFDASRIPRIEMNMDNLLLVLARNNVYRVERGDRLFYKSLSGEINPRIEKMFIRSTITDIL